MTHSLRLLDVPSDVIICILCFLPLKDVPSVEKTCKHLRELIATRQVWLTQLENLDRACAPDLPPHVDVDSLSSAELRNLVANAVRTFQNCLRGEAQYVLKTTVAPEGISDSFGDMLNKNVQLSPGGQYLFVKWSRVRFRIFDLYNNNSCAWSYELQHNRRFYEWSPYAFEMCRDGTITLVLAVDGSAVGVHDGWRIEVHRLTPSSKENRELQSHLIYLCENQTVSVFAKLEGAYITVVSSTGLTVINWGDDWCVRIKNDHVTDIALLHNLLFLCTCKAGQDENTIIFSVIHLDQLSDLHGLEGGPVVCLEDVASSMIPFPIGLHADNRTMAIYPKYGRRRSYSILLFDCQAAGAMQELLSFELEYETDSSSTTPNQPSISLTQRVEALPSTDFAQVDILTRVSRSGCGLLLKNGSIMSHLTARDDRPTGERGYLKFGVKPDGSFFLAPLSQNIQTCMKRAWRPLNCFMEYYSGALVISTDGKSIDIWYPV